MKKTNTNTTQTTTNIEVKQKKERAKRKFFLFVEGQGFIHLDKEVGATPNFAKGEILWYTSLASAKYAREFFTSIKLAENIDILAKVA